MRFLISSWLIAFCRSNRIAIHAPTTASTAVSRAVSTGPHHQGTGGAAGAIGARFTPMTEPRLRAAVTRWQLGIAQLRRLSDHRLQLFRESALRKLSCEPGQSAPGEIAAPGLFDPGRAQEIPALDLLGIEMRSGEQQQSRHLPPPLRDGERRGGGEAQEVGERHILAGKPHERVQFTRKWPSSQTLEPVGLARCTGQEPGTGIGRSEEHTSEL